jgi:prefoldin subunit 5
MEMKSIAEQIETLKKRLHHLNTLCSVNEPQLGPLESEINSLGSKAELIQETLESLYQRREKVTVIWKGLSNTLNKMNE